MHHAALFHEGPSKSKGVPVIQLIRIDQTVNTLVWRNEEMSFWAFGIPPCPTPHTYLCSRAHVDSQLLARQR